MSAPVTAPTTGPWWVGTGWKMTKTRAEARAWCDAVARAADERAATSGDGAGGVAWPGVQPFLFPPATALAEVSDALAAHPTTAGVLVGAQDAHWEDAGAWTGELSVPQVADAGARIVELGHSERREHFAETDERVALKVAAVLRGGLVPLVCVGESAEQRDAGRSVDHVVAQVRAALGGVAASGAPPEVAERLVVAYEPVWAIGESGREAEPDEVAGVVAAVAEEVAGRAAAVVYGGSVTVAGAPGLLAVPGVDGLFVGRTAWRAQGFVALLDLAAGTPRG